MGDLLMLLPNAAAKTLRLCRWTKESSYTECQELWLGHGFSGEPLVDSFRLEEEGVLSIFTLQDMDAGRNVVVLDFKI
jgi:hypothetical protein